ncbi:MAG: Purine nucleoside phosphorylase [Candidatus Methanofastidiosum methylothiophilum]|uniref:Purine nucleoside phosphorylase n=1 Tax=Candidatus Methanofastidiosum methylothiophilum TaxID=1705564 RepID=A0A150IXU4_9EURY|nr:MAG: Purine nucleoside phosphorylase [Candidatus Methanofastidiosum methylthiophilus]NMC75774.1 nucleoside phosphorylase [Candidatus Methanofastidiosa archaeon]
MENQYHIKCKEGDIFPYVIMPGDPNRVHLIGSFMEDVKQVASNREYTTISGFYKGVGVSVTSTGIGAPSTSIAIEELSRIGAKTLIRVGSTGALDEKIKCGDMIINTASVRYDGATKDYVNPFYPAVASYEVTLALIEACEKLQYKYHIGIGASRDTFYGGQERHSFGDYHQSFMDNLIDDLERANVLNLEMEASTVFTLSSLFGLRAGAILAVFGNRKTQEFEVKGEKEASMATLEAIKILSEWDTLKKNKNKRYFYPSLL